MAKPTDSKIIAAFFKGLDRLNVDDQVRFVRDMIDTTGDKIMNSKQFLDWCAANHKILLVNDEEWNELINKKPKTENPNGQEIHHHYHGCCHCSCKPKDR